MLSAPRGTVHIPVATNIKEFVLFKPCFYIQQVKFPTRNRIKMQLVLLKLKLKKKIKKK